MKYLGDLSVSASILAMAIMLQCGLSLKAQASQDGDQKVTVKGKNISFQSVINTIEKQTGLYFFFTTRDLNVEEKVTVDFREKALDDVLVSLLKPKGYSWTYQDNVVRIAKKKNEEKKTEVVKGGAAMVSEEDTVSYVSVMGKVTDAKGNPIPGATVQVKGTQQGVLTDEQGGFQLPEVQSRATIIVSSIGYLTQEVSVRNRRKFTVQLKEYVNALDETVVIAYGTTTKRFSTGNISTVKAAEIERQPVNNPLLALQGRVPGLFITQATGLPGSGVTVRIQGQNSIRKGNDPLYVIDGVPYISQLLPSQNNILGGSGDAINGANGSPMNFISPAEIESIEILKDADATAIYGSRAANGAILITTKKGKSGKTRVDVNVQNGWGKVTRKLDLMNTQQYLQMRHEALRNDAILSPSETDYDINGLWDTTRYTDWQQELVGHTMHYTDAQLSISGGNANTQFLVGAGFHRETTVFPGDFSDRKGSLHFNINHGSSNQKLHLQLSGSYMVDNNQLLQDHLVAKAISLAPNSPAPYSADGALNWAFSASGANTWENPYALLNRKFKSNVNNLVSNVLLSYKVFPEIEIKSSFGYTNLQQNDFNSTPQVFFSPSLWPILGNALRSASYVDNSIQSWIVEPQVSYNRRIGQGKLEMLIGSTLLNTKSNGQSLTGNSYNSDLVLEDISSAATVTVNSTISSLYKYNALFGRLNYNWRDKYIFSLTGRRDGSSRFGPENRFHNFGSIAGAWLFSSEPFIKKLSFLSFGKLRGSYGTTGNDQIGDYQFLNQYIPVNVDMPYLGMTGLNVNGLANPHLQWEETKKMQVGLELGFIEDRISVTGTYFRNRSSNQLLDYALPSTTGFSSVTMNFPATVQNSGWEMMLSTVNYKKRDFVWSSSLNITINRNELIEFPNLTSSSYSDILIIGQPVSVTKAYGFLGVNSQTGLYQFIGSDGHPTSSPNHATDRVAVINTLPEYYGGVQNTISYKDFQLDILFQFVKQLGPNYFFGNYPGSMGNNQPLYLLDRWKNIGDISSHQRVNSDFSLAQQLEYVMGSDAAYSDASYIRLKNISLSWQLPSRWRQTLRLQNAKLYAQGQNLLTITNYKGLDPETMSSASLPPLKVLTIGFQVSL